MWRVDSLTPFLLPVIAHGDFLPRGMIDVLQDEESDAVIDQWSMDLFDQIMAVATAPDEGEESEPIDKKHLVRKCSKRKVKSTSSVPNTGHTPGLLNGANSSKKSRRGKLLRFPLPDLGVFIIFCLVIVCPLESTL